MNMVHVQQMRSEELATVQRLFRTAAYLAVKERPFSDFTSLIDLQVANGVELMNIYRNDKQAHAFIHAEKLRNDTKESMRLSPFFEFSATLVLTKPQLESAVE